MDNEPEPIANDSKKQVLITGTANRYLIKKVMKCDDTENAPKKRKDIGKHELPQEYFTYEKQLTIIDALFAMNNTTDNNNNNNNIDYFKVIKSQIDKKISSYKQQDILKNKYDDALFIQYNYIVELLHTCRLHCYYCCKPMALLYENVRENMQWTVDRINNDLGHNNDNIVLSCLECNLARRKTNQNAFLFTKQLKIKKCDSNNQVNLDERV